MLLLTAILLAVFLLPAPWDAVVIAIGVLGEAGEAAFGIWYSRRREAAVGAEQMVGKTAKVVEPCRPKGMVVYKGERWLAECAEQADVGERVRIRGLDGLTLVVEKAGEQ